MDLEEVLSTLADGKSVLVAHPTALDRMEALGIEVERPPAISPKAAVERLFETRQAMALKLLPKIPGIPSSLPFSIISLYEEIVQCLLFDLHGAAITLCGILTEFALKSATFIVETGSLTAEGYDGERWAELEGITMGPAITRAKRAGLIDDSHEKKLKSFKNNVRNPYAHYNIQKISGSWRWDNVRQINLETGETTEHDGVVVDDPVLQAQAKPEIDRRESLRVFAFADKVAQHVFVQAWEKVRPSEAI